MKRVLKIAIMLLVSQAAMAGGAPGKLVAKPLTHPHLPHPHLQDICLVLAEELYKCSPVDLSFWEILRTTPVFSPMDEAEITSRLIQGQTNMNQMAKVCDNPKYSIIPQPLKEALVKAIGFQLQALLSRWEEFQSRMPATHRYLETLTPMQKVVIMTLHSAMLPDDPPALKHDLKNFPQVAGMFVSGCSFSKAIHPYVSLYPHDFNHWFGQGRNAGMDPQLQVISDNHREIPALIKEVTVAFVRVPKLFDTLWEMFCPNHPLYICKLDTLVQEMKAFVLASSLYFRASLDDDCSPDFPVVSDTVSVATEYYNLIQALLEIPVPDIALSTVDGSRYRAEMMLGLQQMSSLANLPQHGQIPDIIKMLVVKLLCLPSLLHTSWEKLVKVNPWVSAKYPNPTKLQQVGLIATCRLEASCLSDQSSKLSCFLGSISPREQIEFILGRPVGEL
jgi:hypothetical protein